VEKVIKFLVNNQSDAFSVIEKLRELDDKGEISLAENYVLEKDNEGKVVLKNEKGMTFEYTAVGALSGGLVGVLAGPVGFVLGTAYGALLGTTSDLISHGSRENVLDYFGSKMPNGKSMVISHIYEERTTPIDSTLGNLSEIERIDINEETDKAIQADIDETKEKMKDAIGDEKEKIEKKIEELQTKRKARKEQRHANLLTKKKAYKKWFEGMRKK